MNITGKQIAMARILLDLSQKDLADDLSIARAPLALWQRGEHTCVSEH